MWNKYLKTSSLIFAASLFVFGIFYIKPTLVPQTDFSLFYTGARMIIESEGKNIYNGEKQAEFRKQLFQLEQVSTNAFRSPPTVALLFIPLVFLQVKTSFSLFLLLNLTLFFKAIKMIQNEFFAKTNQGLSYLSFFYWPLVPAILNGQLSILMLLLFLLIYKNLREKPLITGLLVSFLFNKPQYLLFFPFAFFLVKEKRKFAGGFVIGIVFFSLVSMFLVGPDVFWSYFVHVLQTEVPEYGAYPGAYIAFASFLYGLGLSRFYVIFANLLVYFFSIYFVFVNSKKLPYEIKFIISVMLTLVFSIHLWVHDLLLLLIPIAVLLKNFKLEGNKLLFFLAFILFWLPFFQYTNVPFVGALFLWAIAFLVLIIYSKRRKMLSKNYKLGSIGGN